MRQRPLDLTPIRRREKRLAAQHPPERLDLGIRPVREVGERAALDLAALAPVLAQEHGGRRRAVRHARDVHKPYRSCYGTPEAKTACLHAHMTPREKALSSIPTTHLSRKTLRKFGLARTSVALRLQLSDLP